MEQTPEEIEAQNAAVQAWNSATFGQIKNRYLALINSPKRSGEGFESLGYSFGNQFGEINRVSYRFNRYLIFVQKGIGTQGKGHHTPLNRTPKPWLSPVLDEEVPKLADIIAKIRGDGALNRIDVKLVPV